MCRFGKPNLYRSKSGKPGWLNENKLKLYTEKHDHDTLTIQRTHRFKWAFVQQIKWWPKQILQRSVFASCSSAIYRQLLCNQNRTVIYKIYMNTHKHERDAQLQPKKYKTRHLDITLTTAGQFFMLALWNRADHYIFLLSCSFFFFFFLA